MFGSTQDLRWFCQRQAKALAVPLTCQQVERFCGGTTSLAQAPTAASDVYSGGVAMAKAGHLFLFRNEGCQTSKLAKAFMGLDLQVASCWIPRNL